MHAKLLASTALLSLFASTLAVADDSCAEPVADWQPRDVLRQQVEQQGWTVQRIKVDDGCYEVRGTDRKGNKLEAKYAPASLKLRSLEIDFRDGGDASDYLPPRP
ncbi:MAG: PepSY domain-containing protein [Pseudomonas sp.]|uniref:PepSY domain-containing protein n=1 Tax=Pseudomonas sp. TaxID=306 RepID=UPI003BB6272A